MLWTQYFRFESCWVSHITKGVSHGGRRKRRKIEILEVVGKTEDDIFIVTGLFELLNTYGIPIPISMMIMNGKGMMPDWIGFIKRSRSSGWNDKTILSRLGEGVLEIYGKDFYDGWIIRITKVINSIPKK